MKLKNIILDFSSNQFSRVIDNSFYNCLSYKNTDISGGNVGKFIISGLYIQNMIKNNHNKHFALTPIKSDFYPLYFDFDNKSTMDFHNKNNFYSIVKIFIDIIINFINSISINTDCSFIYSHKFINSNDGVHLYFPNIIVNKCIHSIIYSNVLKISISMIDSISSDIIRKIFDKCVISNGLRLFYFYFNNDFYFPSNSLSTFHFDPEPINNVSLSFLNTSYTSTNICFINQTAFFNSNIIFKSPLISNHPSSNNISDSSNNITDSSNNIHNIIDINFITPSDKVSFITDLLNLLTPSFYNNYDQWINIIFILKNFSLFDLAVSFSKKSFKFDSHSLSIIHNIFYNNHHSNNLLTLGSLIFWAFDSSPFDTIDVLENYNISLKFNSNFNITNINNILLKNNFNNVDFSENSIFISDSFKKYFISKIDNIFSDQPNINCLILQSPTGSGKTTLINAILNNIPSFSRVLSVVCRRSMVATHNNAFTINNRKIFTNYLDFPSSFDFSFIDNNYFICSFDSIPKLGHNSYDVLILDEISSLISYFYSDTLSDKRVSCLSKLKNLIDSATFIIACDSQISDSCFELLKGKKIFFYQNLALNKKNIPFIIYKFPKYNISPYSNIFKSNLFYFVNFIFYKSIQFKKSTIIYLDSLSLLSLLKSFLLDFVNKHNSNLSFSHPLFIDFNSYFIFFSSFEGSLDLLNNINSISSNKCIITTPKITTGLDILTDFSDNVFCLYSNIYKDKSMDVFSYYQQLSRSRNATQINFFLLNFSNNYNKFISFNKNKIIEDKLISNCINFLKSNFDHNFIFNDFLFIDFFKNINYFHSWYKRLFNSDKLNILLLILSSVGYSISFHYISDISYHFDSSDIQLIIDSAEKNFHNMLVNFFYSSDFFYSDPNFYDLYLLIHKRKNYVPDSVPNKLQICCNTSLFNHFINKTFLCSSDSSFHTKLFNDFIHNSSICLKNSSVFNQIKAILFLENLLNINRFQFDFSLSFDQIQSFKHSLIINKHLFDSFYGFKSPNFIISKCNSFHNINERILCFLIDCYNHFSNGIISFQKKTAKVYFFRNFYSLNNKLLQLSLSSNNILFSPSDINVISTKIYYNISVNFL
jgi:hypothetical protein